jgi:coatomer subunit beta
MHIITNIIPIQHKSPNLRKVMLLYWEIIDKNKSPTDKSLKEEVFLACNSLRNDLIGHNEYVRGRTLRLISRIMHRGVIEPLATAITNNLQHQSAYVRRNAVICLYNIFITFGSDIIG